MWVVFVNGKYSDEYVKQENAEAHAETARRLGNEASISEQYEIPAFLRKIPLDSSC
jgi:hypothetical protein